jgi:vacuolar-type H+-ATPase subunit I/STV1
MKKLLAYICLVLIALLLAGFYGVVHDQISYTVSPEYFTKFKFTQFGMAELNLPDRDRAAIVGFLASWWMGLPIGLLVGGCGFLHPGFKPMCKFTLLSFAVVMGITMLFGGGGLLFGFYQTRTFNPNDYQGWYIPAEVIDLRQFFCVGYMHNASYLGGTLGIFAGCIYQLIAHIKSNRQ